MIILHNTIVGSKLYGTDCEESDTDYKGIFLPSLKESLKFNTQHEYNAVSYDDGHKIEETWYSLQKFLMLCGKGNPTILEIACVDDKFITTNTEMGKSIRTFVRDNCVYTQETIKAYFGYFQQQLHKFKNKVYDKDSTRNAIIEKYGYDTKFACHAARLYFQVIEIFNYRIFNPTLKMPMLGIARDIRYGKISHESVLFFLELCNETFTEYYENNLSSLPKINFTNLEQFYIDTTLSYYKENMQ